MKYERDLMAAWDAYAIKKAREEEKKTIRKEAREKGLEEGREQGRQEGREKGREEGEERKSYEVVKNLLTADRFTIAEIANFASVSESFVRRIKKELKKC